MRAPAGPIRTLMTGERIGPARKAEVEVQVERQRHVVVPGPVGQEGKVERGAVPRDQHARREPGDRRVEPGEQPRLAGEVARGEHLGGCGPCERDGHHVRHTGVEAVDRRVGLDIEPVDRRRIERTRRRRARRHRCTP